MARWLRGLDCQSPNLAASGSNSSRHGCRSCTAFSVKRPQLKQCLTVCMSYTSLKSEQETLLSTPSLEKIRYTTTMLGVIGFSNSKKVVSNSTYPNHSFFNQIDDFMVDKKSSKSTGKCSTQMKSVIPTTYPR